MSFILDSLNKADHEQQPQEAVPSLKTRYFSPMAQQTYGFSPVAIGVIAVLIGALVALVIVLLFNERGPVSPVPVPVATTAPEPVSQPILQVEPTPKSAAPQNTVPQATVSLEPETVPTKSEADPLIAELYAAAQQAPEPIVQNTNRPIVIQPQNAPGTLTPERELAIVEAQRLWDESKPKPLPAGLNAVSRTQKTVQPKKKSSTTLQSGPSVEKSSAIPFLHELPVSVQNQIPTLMYAKHMYEQGLVILNKKRYAQGERVAEKVILERILADGIVLSMDGREFKLGAQSSWVNF